MVLLTRILQKNCCSFYQERFPTRRVESYRKTFERLHWCQHETGSFISDMQDTGRTRRGWTSQIADNTLHKNVDHSSSKVHALIPACYQQRVDLHVSFCNRLQHSRNLVHMFYSRGVFL
ncbi:hypothetical protein CDAR_260101 [Caerostris darwini]|uniref:Uncharacterized protein n=1 Tax=Caerostris darwini TaxID=1538125 RepID=A0AAV4VA78_9ARAC|nr:hypothetical protein CDAR_260101 [Caerostris darwini]